VLSVKCLVAQLFGGQAGGVFQVLAAYIDVQKNNFTGEYTGNAN
jgi:hypothetical protein